MSNKSRYDYAIKHGLSLKEASKKQKEHKSGDKRTTKELKVDKETK